MNEIIVNQSQTRSIEQLTDQEKELVKKKLSSLDYMSPTSVIQFGSESSKEVTQISSQMISKFKVKDFEEAEALIVNLLGELQTVNPNMLLEKRKKGFFAVAKKKTDEKVTKVLSRQMSLETAIDKVEDKLTAAKLSLMQDMEFCSQMIEKTYEYASMQELEYIAIQEALKDANAHKEELEELFRANPNNIEYSYKIAEVNRAINRLENKAYNLLVFRTSTLQSVTQIGYVQGGDELMVSKIDDTIINVIPAWKNNFAIALSIYRLNNAVEIERVVNNATNEFLIKNSEMLKDTLLNTAAEMERPSIDPETLKIVNQNMKETFDGLSKVREEARKTRESAIKTVQSIQTMALELQSGTSIEKKDNEEGVSVWQGRFMSSNRN